MHPHLLFFALPSPLELAPGPVTPGGVGQADSSRARAQRRSPSTSRLDRTTLDAGGDRPW